MRIRESLTEWMGRTVVDWSEAAGITDPKRVAYRIRFDGETKETGMSWSELMASFLRDPRLEELESLIIGDWCPDYDYTPSSDVIESLVSASSRLPHLTSLFLGDITSEEGEISWIVQSDISPLFGAFPQLEHLGVRGSQELSLGTPHHDHLKTLILESGGLPLTVIQEVIAAELPVLEHLELWLGDQGYGGDSTLEDLRPIFHGTDRWPHLTYLGLCNCEYTDAIAAAIVTAPILPQLETLDLSLGTLSDKGATVLADAPGIAHLKKLDIHHHFVSPEIVSRLEALPIATVDSSDVQEPYSWRGDDEDGRFVAVGE